MCMLDKIQAKREEIHAIARTHKAEKLWVFGSVAIVARAAFCRTSLSGGCPHMTGSEGYRDETRLERKRQICVADGR